MVIRNNQSDDSRQRKMSSQNGDFNGRFDNYPNNNNNRNQLNMSRPTHYPGQNQYRRNNNNSKNNYYNRRANFVSNGGGPGGSSATDSSEVSSRNACNHNKNNFSRNNNNEVREWHLCNQDDECKEVGSRSENSKINNTNDISNSSSSSVISICDNNSSSNAINEKQRSQSLPRDGDDGIDVTCGTTSQQQQQQQPQLALDCSGDSGIAPSSTSSPPSNALQQSSQQAPQPPPPATTIVVNHNHKSPSNSIPPIIVSASTPLLVTENNNLVNNESAQQLHHQPQKEQPKQSQQKQQQLVKESVGNNSNNNHNHNHSNFVRYDNLPHQLGNSMIEPYPNFRYCSTTAGGVPLEYYPIANQVLLNSPNDNANNYSQINYSASGGVHYNSAQPPFPLYYSAAQFPFVSFANGEHQPEMVPMMQAIYHSPGDQSSFATLPFVGAQFIPPTQSILLNTPSPTVTNPTVHPVETPSGSVYYYQYDSQPNGQLMCLSPSTGQQIPAFVSGHNVMETPVPLLGAGTTPVVTPALSYWASHQFNNSIGAYNQNPVNHPINHIPRQQSYALTPSSNLPFHQSYGGRNGGGGGGGYGNHYGRGGNNGNRRNNDGSRRQFFGNGGGGGGGRQNISRNSEPLPQVSQSQPNQTQPSAHTLVTQ